MNIEVHDGFYFLPAKAVKEVLAHTICITHGDCTYLTPAPEYTFILLLTNTYENSESFFSCTYDFGAVLGDYVDLRFFFEKYRCSLDWHAVSCFIDAYGLHGIAEIILGNLQAVYGRDVTLGCLPAFRPRESKWGGDIIARMSDAGFSRQIVLSAMRARWLAQAAKSPLYVDAATGQTDLAQFQPCVSHDCVRYLIAHSGDSFLLSWAIPISMREDGDTLLFQFNFFPLAESISYISYKLDISIYDDDYTAYGHQTRHLRLGSAVRKKVGAPIPVYQSKVGQFLILQVSLPCAALEFSGLPEKQTLCVAAEIFKKHCQDIYHYQDNEQLEPALSLIEIINTR